MDEPRPISYVVVDFCGKEIRLYPKGAGADQDGTLVAMGETATGTAIIDAVINGDEVSFVAVGHQIVYKPSSRIKVAHSLPKKH